MKTSVAAALAATMLLPAVPAGARTGFLCGYTVLDHRRVPGGAWVGEVDGGPLLAADVFAPGGETAEIQLVCTIQAGAAGATHAGPDLATAASPATPGVAVLPPTPVSFVQPADTPFFLCTAVRLDGVLLYHDADTETWSSSPDVPCGYAICSCPQPAYEVTVEDVDGDGDEEVVVTFYEAPAPTYRLDPDGDGDPDVVCTCPV